MKKEEKKQEKKIKYVKPKLTKHQKLKDITAGVTNKSFLGCTRFFV